MPKVTNSEYKFFIALLLVGSLASLIVGFLIVPYNPIPFSLLLFTVGFIYLLTLTAAYYLGKTSIDRILYTIKSMSSKHLGNVGLILLFIAIVVFGGIKIIQNQGKFHGYNCTGDCSGHKAGYEWARDKGICDPDNCGGKSQSFIEGCKSYATEYFCY